MRAKIRLLPSGYVELTNAEGNAELFFVPRTKGGHVRRRPSGQKVYKALGWLGGTLNGPLMSAPGPELLALIRREHKRRSDNNRGVPLSLW